MIFSSGVYIYFFLFLFLTIFFSSIISFFFFENIVYNLIGFLSIMFSVTCLLFSLHVEFMSYIILIVYLGAIIILFLFVIMMIPLNINKYNFSKFKKLHYLFLFLLSFKLLSSIITFYKCFSHLSMYDSNSFYLNFFNISKFKYIKVESINYSLYDISSIGYILYTDFFFYFILIALILLFAMVGILLLLSRFNLKINKVFN